MRKTVFSAISYSVLLIVCMSMFSCKKSSTSDNNNPVNPNDPCVKLALLHAHPFIAVTKGDQITITADSLQDANYYWSGPNSFQSYYQTNIVSSSADYFNRGWYYVRISYPGCTDRFDSIYVNVKFPQGTASCTPANNSATFSGPLLLGNQSYSFVSFGAVAGGYGITGNSSNGDMNITMSAYWDTHDMEDGVYYSTSNPIPDYADLDKVFLSNVNQSIYWVGEPDKPVYISHVAGKQRITFCGIQFSGDWGGTLYHTTVSSQITQP